MRLAWREVWRRNGAFSARGNATSHSPKVCFHSCRGCPPRTPAIPARRATRPGAWRTGATAGVPVRR
ncbi:hypothetical protein FGJ01_13245 [Hydrogenophaga intermedia]|nr:hypothetical protein FGJ01_13245 [Hydrogenophaga intermedia]